MAIQWAKRKVRKWLGREGVHTPPGAQARFQLVYDDLTIGILSLDGGDWKFEYSDEFRKSTDLRPITEFPDVHKVYRSDDLWPFFAIRIPSLKQTAIEKTIQRESIDRTSNVELLRRFGKRTISNPFELVYLVT